ncbi:Gp15 family bacteriophage protein, partial [Paraclostridium bifermentans]|uniref:Gp15 family bacteriophage protein n=1 Tax=Paraclostridium bifermentans TaxID=1490 RepID=UPI0022DF46E9
MNILVDLLPTSVNIDAKRYEINSDFRTSILFELLIQDSSIDYKNKIYMAL